MKYFRELDVPTFTLIVVCVVAMIFVLFFGKPLEVDDPLNNNMTVLWGPVVFFMAVAASFWYKSIYQSSGVYTFGNTGKDTCATTKERATIHMQTTRDTKKKIFKYPLKAFDAGGYSAFGVPVAGGGNKGWYIVWDIPGVIQVHGENVHFAIEQWRVYLPNYTNAEYTHRDIGWIVAQLKNQICQLRGGMVVTPKWDDNCPIYLGLIPAQQLETTLNLEPGTFTGLVSIEDYMNYAETVLADSEERNEKLEEFIENDIARAMLMSGRKPPEQPKVEAKDANS